MVGRDLNQLINSAEVARETTLASENVQSMLASYTTTTIGPMLVCQEFLPLLRRAACRGMLSGLRGDKAAVVNVSSSCGSLSLVEGWEWKQDVGYRCSKAALNMLTQCQALTYRLWGILCIAIHPGGAASQVGAEQVGSEIPTMECRIRGILDVLAKLSAADNGTFLDWKGDVVPW
ncbi:C-factor-like [Varanus komodoensis]|uniref:C-factor-like n=1 Tax=Varanus komodoensis TaxID=61221 RepID=UPI001CF7D7BA|nr:C-factor-like [Varanus komodoensis]